MADEYGSRGVPCTGKVVIDASAHYVGCHNQGARAKQSMAYETLEVLLVPAAKELGMIQRQKVVNERYHSDIRSLTKPRHNAGQSKAEMPTVEI